METAQIAEPISGDKLYQIRARRALPLLVRQAQAGEPITYGDLATELAMPNARNLNYVLGSIGHTLNNLSEHWDEKIPPIQCLVVNKASRLPGEGVGWFISDMTDYRKLSNKQQRQVVDAELTKVYSYSKWREVLKALELKPTTQDFSHLTDSAKKHRGGGEGLDHKLLKAYVANNPDRIGLPKKLAPGIEEYPLPSGDILDAFFESRTEFIGIEVKPISSDLSDLTRGLYQCIKYQAVLEACQAAKGKPQNARTILVLGGALPKELLPLKNVLGIEVIENIQAD